MKKTTRALARLSALLLAGALLCWSLYGAIGSYIDGEGFLHEPFALIPLGWLFLFGAIACGVAAMVTTRTGRPGAGRDCPDRRG